MTYQRNNDKRKQIIGKKFGLLTVLEEAGYSEKGHSSLSRCKCDCGNICTIRNNNLLSGNT